MSQSIISEEMMEWIEKELKQENIEESNMNLDHVLEKIQYLINYHKSELIDHVQDVGGPIDFAKRGSSASISTKKHE